LNKRTAVKYGLLTGFAVILYLLVFYLIDKPLVRHLGVVWSRLFVYIIGMFWAAMIAHRARGGKKIKSAETSGKFNIHDRDDEEELPFRKMIGVPFLVFLIANAYYYVFIWWIMNVYDADLLQMHQELSHQEALEYFKGEEGIDKIKANKPEDYTPSIRGSIRYYFEGAIGGFILSLLIALGVRRA